MPLVHGENITSSEVEREISSWDAAPFARLANALAWAVTWRTTPHLPAFTERVNVSDNGIDANGRENFPESEKDHFSGREPMFFNTRREKSPKERGKRL